MSTRAAGRLVATLAAMSLGGAAVAQQPAPPAVPAGMLVKLMVLKEVNSRTARAGDRFRMRVNEPVVVDGATAVPVGTDGWGEVVFVDGTGLAGAKGRLTARLLYVDLPGGRLPLVGDQQVDGKANTAGVAFGILSFGLAGLLTKGGNAHFKAGDILVGQVAPAERR